MTIYNINGCVKWGALVTAAGALLTVGWPSLFQLYRKRMMVLANGSMSFDVWQKLPIPLYSEFYLYNITNVDDILAGKNVKIRVQQMGPYVFRETQTKVNLVWNANSTLTYQTKRVWHFQPDRSNGSLSDIITNINLFIPTIAYILRNENSVIQMLANMIVKMYYSNIFVSANASSWLFDGIENHLLSISNQIPNLPYFVPFDRIGWLYTRNGSADYDGWFVVNTGAEDFSRLGEMELFNHFNQTMYRGSCGKVHGSTGELWAPRKDQSEISFFAGDLRTSLALAVSGPVTIKGIEGTMFVANDSIFDNGQKYPRKGCHCEDSSDDCMPSGVLNTTERAYGAPAFVTLPHFRYVDAYYADKIEGMEPTEADDFKIAIEMVTGMPLMVQGQIQVNFLVRHNTWMRINNQLPDPDLLVPVIWVRERAFVDDSYSSFARLVLNIYYTMPYVLYIVVAIGVALFSAGLWMIKYPKVRGISENIEAHKFLSQCDSN